MRVQIGAVIWALLLAAGGDAPEHVEKEEITKSLPFPAGGTTRQLVVDNISGSIAVTGYSGNEVQLIVRRTSYADTPEGLRESKEKISLDIRQEPGRIILYVMTPWRCDGGDGSCRSRRDPGFDADFDFEIKVPARTDLLLKTVNKGEVTVDNVSGVYDVSNVNGEISMSRVTGAGIAATVNGHVTVDFSRNPEARCGFRTVNGSIEARFPDALSAVLRMKTMNGDMVTDFTVTALPGNPPSMDRVGRRTVYRGDQYTSVRAGTGGPELIFETLNGDINILKSQH